MRETASEKISAVNTKVVNSPILQKIKERLNRSVNRKPAYRITSDGIVREYFDFSKKDTLPFDIETYNDTQIFLGSYANPWYVDIEAIEKEYDTYGYGDPITDLISKQHVIPSQRYKAYMNQGVLTDTFQAAGLDSSKVIYLLYAIVGISAFNLLVMIT